MCVYTTYTFVLYVSEDVYKVFIRGWEEKALWIAKIYNYIKHVLYYWNCKLQINMTKRLEYSVPVSGVTLCLKCLLMSKGHVLLNTLLWGLEVQVASGRLRRKHCLNTPPDSHIPNEPYSPHYARFLFIPFCLYIFDWSFVLDKCTRKCLTSILYIFATMQTISQILCLIYTTQCI